MSAPLTPESTGTATYCPEDDKLRLYVGRVPRSEYDYLREQGWTATPKQGCDFAAVWTPSRRDTAAAYAEDGIIDDEDMGPEDRAADRAERFAGYLDKRIDDADLHAGRYEAKPSAHGYQSEARAERAAARHDRIGTRATDAWGKAEYWQRRTSGVISHALHKSSPDVRMGRIKTLESELRKREADRSDWSKTWSRWKEAAATQDTEKQRKMVEFLGGNMHTYDFHHPDPETVTNARIKGTGTSICTLLSMVEHGYGTVDVTPDKACAMFFERYPNEPAEGTEWTQHLKLRLAYENQMLEAQGGRAAHIEIIVGGWLRGGRRLGDEERRIIKVNKSHVTGRVVSVDVRDNRPSTHNHWGNPFPDGGTKTLIHNVEVERMAPDAYRPPTPEELAAFHDETNARKAATPKKETIPLINPTDGDAQRLQDLINARAKAKHDARPGAKYLAAYEPKAITRITQAAYSANSKGSYARAETRNVHANGEVPDSAENIYRSRNEKERQRIGPALCHVRVTGYDPASIIILTDKPQKPLPVGIWPVSNEAEEVTFDLTNIQPKEQAA